MKKVWMLIVIMTLILTSCGTETETIVTESTSNQSQAANQTSDAEGMALATNVVKSSFVGTIKEYGSYTDFLFKAEEEYKGSGIEKEFWLRLSSTGYDSSSDMIAGFKKGSHYLLALEKRVSVYEEHDFYIMLYKHDMYDDSERVNVEMNNNITNHYKELIASTTDRSNEIPVGYDYIRNDDIDKIIEESPYIAFVEITETGEPGLNGRSTECKCSVIKSIKGQLEGSIDVIFVEGSVEVGNQYVIMIDNPDNFTKYILTSKHSVYRNDKSNDAINKLINE